jgi:putative transposase
MTNHVHLILDPGQRIDAIALLMKRVAGRTTRHVNRLEDRSGTLWDGRYKSSPIQSDAYLLACWRYVELNPVRAGIVDSPEEYKWSSYLHRIGLVNEPWLDQHTCYDDLGVSNEIRRQEYREWVQDDIPQNQLNFIRKMVQRGQLTGSARFKEEVYRRIGRRVECRGRGRPRKK